MLSVNCVGRTVEVYPMVSETKVGYDEKPYVSKSITFKIATDRDYPVTKMVNGAPLVINGVVQKERKADFVFCRALGSIAELLSQYATERKNDTKDSKIISRHIYCSGHFETYEGTKEVKMAENIAIPNEVTGVVTYKKITFTTDVKTKEIIFIVKHLEFLDSKAGEQIKTILVNKEKNILIEDVEEGFVPPTGASANEVPLDPNESISAPVLNKPTPILGANGLPVLYVGGNAIKDEKGQYIQLDVDGKPLKSADDCPW